LLPSETITLSEEERLKLRKEVREPCEKFGNEYWRELDPERKYPQEFVDALTQAGYLSVLIPEEYGGRGYGMTEATSNLEEIHRGGGHADACYDQMLKKGVLLRQREQRQKEKSLA